MGGQAGRGLHGGGCEKAEKGDGGGDAKQRHLGGTRSPRTPGSME